MKIKYISNEKQKLEMYNKAMVPLHEGLPQKLLEPMPVSAEDWEKTPESVQDLVIELLRRLQVLEAEVAKLREQVGRKTAV